MVLKHWLRSYIRTDGKGYHLIWYEDGAQAAIWLKLWDRRLALDADDNCPVLLAEIARGSRPIVSGVAKNLNALMTALLAEKLLAERGRCAWTDRGAVFFNTFAGLLDDLGLLGTQDDLVVLFSIARGWAPDGVTEFRPLPTE